MVQPTVRHGGPRARKIGIVAVARRLVIDLWRYLDAGVIPEGAILKGRADGTQRRINVGHAKELIA